MADKRTARVLGIDTRSPVLYQRQHLFAEHGQPVAISTAWYRGDKNVFKVTRSRGDAGLPALPHSQAAAAGNGAGEPKS